MTQAGLLKLQFVIAKTLEQFLSMLDNEHPTVDANALEALKVSQSTAGYFNIPVCKVLDLRSFPPVNANNQEFKDGE